MHVLKRSGNQETFVSEKITARILGLCGGLDRAFVDPQAIATKVMEGVYDGVPTTQLDELAAETAAAMSTQHPDLSVLAGRIAVSNLHKQTSPSFRDTVSQLYHHVHARTGELVPLVSADLFRLAHTFCQEIDALLDHGRDMEYDYFGFKTLERSYLLRVNGEVRERPQHMLMRVALGLHGDNMDRVAETYDLMSHKLYTHATPTLFNIGTPVSQLSSCFLLQLREDSIHGIFDTLKQCALISKCAGGIGVSIHNARARGSYIRGTNGTANGIVPMLRVFSDTARFVDQGGRRKGSFAMYLEPWHADVFEFLDLKKNHGDEQHRARDLFYALWVPDLFMQRVKNDQDWSLFCPNECPGLADVHGDAFVALYETYEKQGKARRVLPAKKLWFAVLESQVETGGPYMMYKDACNRKSNQQNLGTIKSSNLCTEVVQYTSSEEIAVCNLASLNLQSFVVDDDGAPPTYDLDHLYRVTKVVTRNLNRVIDINHYPLHEARTSNMRHRPIGIGVQGLADAFIRMRFPFESAQARQLNKDIFETIYFGACEASMELAREHGAYETFSGSPASQGKLQFDLWGVQPSARWDWKGLKQSVQATGMRNSLLVAPMPTASTAQILGNNESTEPFTSNMYTRRVLAGEFTVVNKHLIQDLIKAGVWCEDMRNQLIADRGSVQANPDVPPALRELYKTVWEIKQRAILDMAADRGAFVCQSQSLNIHIADPTMSKLTSMHFYGWEKGLKTGMYYLRTQPRANAIQFTVNQRRLRSVETNVLQPEGAEVEESSCLMCSA